MVQQTEFFDFVDKAIELNIKNRIKKLECKNLITPIQYWYEFCTIKINLGRNMGYTSYVKSHANINSICVFNNDRFYRKNEYPFVNNIFTKKDLTDKISNIFRGISFSHIQTIYVDEASSFTNDELYHLYENVSIANHKNTEKTFILFG